MIVNYTAKGWQIITQRSHGLLAAQICAYWREDNQPVRWPEILIATAGHDDVYNELENNDILEDNGGPVNFKMAPFQEEYCDRLMSMALTKSRYIGLLTSRHIQFLYDKEPAAKRYCGKLKKQEAVWRRESRISKREIDNGYGLLQFCDAFSLLICQHMIQPEHRKIEISKGPDGKSYQLHGVNAYTLIVTPWPFGVSSFKVNFESRTIPQLVFGDTAELKNAILAAKVNLTELIIKDGHG